MGRAGGTQSRPAATRSYPHRLPSHPTPPCPRWLTSHAGVDGVGDGACVARRQLAGINSLACGIRDRAGHCGGCGVGGVGGAGLSETAAQSRGRAGGRCGKAGAAGIGKCRCSACLLERWRRPLPWRWPPPVPGPGFAPPPQRSQWLHGAGWGKSRGSRQVSTMRLRWAARHFHPAAGPALDPPVPLERRDPFHPTPLCYALTLRDGLGVPRGRGICDGLRGGDRGRQGGRAR